MCQALFRLSIDSYSNAELMILPISVTGTQERSLDGSLPFEVQFATVCVCVFISLHGVLVGCECVIASVLRVKQIKIVEKR